MRLPRKTLTCRRKRDESELPWQRPGDFKELDLPRPVALINGAFDLLHGNHLRIISEACQRAKTIVCALDSDKRVAASKGPGRPILTWLERAAILQHLPIDYLVEIESEEDFIQLVKALRPNVRVQGAEYRGKTSRFPNIPKVFVPNYGLHTSEIIKRCQRLIK